MVNFQNGSILKNVVTLHRLVELSIIVAISLYALSIYIDWAVPREELFPLFTKAAEEKFQMAEDFRLYSALLGVISLITIYIYGKKVD